MNNGNESLVGKTWEQLTLPTLTPDAAPGQVRIRADMLPPSTWGSNLRGILRDVAWRRLSRSTSERAGDRCEICGSESRGPYGKTQRPDCHEMWVFEREGDALVQRLERLIALCKACHNAQHAGRAAQLGLVSAVIETLRSVNDWGKAEAERDFERAWDRYGLMQNLSFDLDLRTLTGVVTVRRAATLYFSADDREWLGNSWTGKRTGSATPLFELPEESSHE